MESLLVISDTELLWKRASYRIAIGRGGRVDDKHEGDGGTPRGIFPLRRVFYNPSRLDPPATSLPVRAITPQDGWSDDPKDPAYNCLVTLPHPYHYEIMWREDNIYDVLIEVGYNDNPAVPGKGSAIFIHIARPNYPPTHGCIALAREDLLAIVKDLTLKTMLQIV